MKTRPTRFWLDALRKRRARIAGDELDLSQPISFRSADEQRAAIAFFNAALRAEESGLHQAHVLSEQTARWDPELAECLKLYGDEEGWHRQLLNVFLPWLGGEVRPTGPTTRTFYGLYQRAQRMESIVLVNLMFETIGSTTYRLARRHASHPTIRQMLTILTRDESFHVPLNVHFLRQALARAPRSRARLRAIYHCTFMGLVASTWPSRRRAERFDGIPRGVLSRAYATELARLFLEEDDLGLEPSRALLFAFGLDREALLRRASTVTVEAAERAAGTDDIIVEAATAAGGPAHVLLGRGA